MLISEYLKKEPSNTNKVITCKGAEAVMVAVNRMAENNIGSIVVLDGEGIVGIFTERDVIQGLHHKGAAFLEESLEENMITKVVTVDPNQSLDDALLLMNEHRIRHLPVVAEGEVVRVLSVRNLIAQKLVSVKNTAEFLQQQVQTGSKPLPM